MQIEIKNEVDNKLLKRRELLIRVDYEGKSTPSCQELEAAIASQKKVDFMKVKAKNIFSDHGRPFGTAHIRIYDEPIQEKIEAQKKAEEAKKEKPAEKKEAKPEEKKEESKPDAPKEEAKEGEAKPAASDTKEKKEEKKGD